MEVRVQRRRQSNLTRAALSLKVLMAAGGPTSLIEDGGRRMEVVVLVLVLGEKPDLPVLLPRIFAKDVSRK